ncbi:heterokaryon incompatibility protein [Stagonosporopsis vannaccii]|nr:heterokaryon incompatibility protein [Stagonosporopsis vannaccii]
MSLCVTCSLLPVRDVIRFCPEAESPLSRLLVWKDCGSRAPNQELTAFLKLNRTLRDLKAGTADCPLCRLIYEGLQSSLRYHDPAKRSDESETWLELQENRLLVWLGNQIEPLSDTGGVVVIRTTKDSPFAQYLSSFTVIHDALSPVVLGTIESWLRVCSGEIHENCPQLEETKRLPTRLLDLSKLPRRQDMINQSQQWHAMFQKGSCRLVETMPGSTGQYVALSYCWGSHVPCKTVSANLELHKENGGIKFTQLPQTLQDAVFLVRYLGLNYLWADCLCIIQDDTADWEYEAAHMADVYTNAFLTLAAMRASHCREGFLGPRTPRTKTVPVVFSDHEGEFTLHLNYSDRTESPGSLAAAVEQNPLKLQREEPMMDRVWCFQERVLARRTIHFTSHEVYWECQASLWRETEQHLLSLDRYSEYSIADIAGGLMESNDSGPDRRHLPLQHSGRRPWYAVVKEYTARNMTYQKDKLPALSGIIAAVQQITGDVCYAGIWRSWFLLGLLWRTQDPASDPYAYVLKTPYRPHEWRAPSWSFAAIEGIAMYHGLPEHDVLCAKLHECCVVPKGLNPLGELKSGFVRLEAPKVIITGICCVDIMDQTSPKMGMVRIRDQAKRPVHVMFDLEHLEICEALLITPSMGIAVVPFDLDQQQYVRIGIIELPTNLFMTPGFPNGATFDQLTISDWPEPTSVILL